MKSSSGFRSRSFKSVGGILGSIFRRSKQIARVGRNSRVGVGEGRREVNQVEIELLRSTVSLQE
jgi:hypothetical protein